MSVNPAVANALAEALALMNDDGKHWNKGWYQAVNEDGELTFCSIGAVHKITQAPEQKWLRERMTAALTAVIPEKYFPGERGWKRVVIWNDAEETTWEDVVEVFTQAQEQA